MADPTTLITSIISGLMIAAISSVAGWALHRYTHFKKEYSSLIQVNKQIEQLIDEHKIVMNSIRNINRAQIMDICYQALYDGYIEESKFRCLCELDESYKSLGGNSYADELVDHVRALEIRPRIKEGE